MGSKAEEFKRSFLTMVRKDSGVDGRRKLLDGLLRSPEFALEMEVADVAVACSASPFVIKGRQAIFDHEEMDAFIVAINGLDGGETLISDIRSLIADASNDPNIGPLMNHGVISSETQIDDADPVDAEDDEESASEPGSLFDSLKEVG